MKLRTIKLNNHVCYRVAICELPYFGLKFILCTTQRRCVPDITRYRPTEGQEFNNRCTRSLFDKTKFIITWCKK